MKIMHKAARILPGVSNFLINCRDNDNGGGGNDEQKEQEEDKDEEDGLKNQTSGFPGGSVSKESTCNAGDLGSIPALGRSPGGGHGNPLQYSCLENPMDRGAWWATVYRVTKNRTQLSDGLCIINLSNWTPNPCFLYLLW